MITTDQELSQFAGKRIRIEKGSVSYAEFCMGKPDRFTDGELNRSGLFVLFDVYASRSKRRVFASLKTMAGPRRQPRATRRIDQLKWSSGEG